MGLKTAFNALFLVFLAGLGCLSNVTVNFLAYVSSSTKFVLYLSEEVGFISSFDCDLDLVFYREIFRARGVLGLGVNGLDWRCFFDFLVAFGEFVFTLGDFKVIFGLFVVILKSLADFDGKSLLFVVVLKSFADFDGDSLLFVVILKSLADLDGESLL